MSPSPSRDRTAAQSLRPLLNPAFCTHQTGVKKNSPDILQKSDLASTVSRAACEMATTPRVFPCALKMVTLALPKVEGTPSAFDVVRDLLVSKNHLRKDIQFNTSCITMIPTCLEVKVSRELLTQRCIP